MISKKFLREQEDIVLDSGIYIEYFTPKESTIKKLIRETIFTEDSQINLHGHYLLKSEIYYIICRFLGMEESEKIIREIEKYINFISGNFIYNTAGKIKCNFPIALSDCYSISTGIFFNCPILFLKETELSKTTVKKINSKFGSKIFVFP
jgi:hypothetical protein